MSSSTKQRVVLDANVLISGVLWGGKPGLIIKWYRQGTFALFISPFILAELANFLEEYQVDKKHRETILQEFKTRPVKIIPPKKVSICRDNKDNQILDLCLAAHANLLVTGDRDLLALKEFEKTKIVNPGAFLRLVRGRH